MRVCVRPCGRARAGANDDWRAQLLGLAINSGAYEGAVLGTLAKKRDDVGAKLGGIRAVLSESAAQRADSEAKQELAKWQAGRGAGRAVAAPSPKPERDAFKLAIEVLKEATQHKALVIKGDESRRSDAVRLFTEGAALLAEAIASPKSERVQAALEKKLEDVKGAIVELNGSVDAEDLPAAPTKSASAPRRSSGSAPPPSSKRGTSPRNSFSEPAGSRSSSRSSSRGSSRSVTPPAIPRNVAGKSPRNSVSAPAGAPKPELQREPKPEPTPELAAGSTPVDDRSIPENVDEMRPFQLKKELRTRRLDQEGTKEELAQRLKDYAAGKISPPDLEKTPEQIASALVGCTLRALKAPPLKATSEESSSRAGNLKKGEEVVVTEYVVLNPGSEEPVVRLRCDRGWFSLNNKKGEPMLENLGQGKTPTKLPPKPKPEPEPEPEPTPQPAPAPLTPGSPSGSTVKAGAAALRAASTNPFKESVPILKEAAAADARVRQGDESSAPEALRLYRQGLALLEEAIADPQFKAGVKAAMRKRVTSAHSRVTTLEKMVGDAATSAATAGTLLAIPAGTTESPKNLGDSSAVADEWQAHMDAAAAAGRAAEAAAAAAASAAPNDPANNAGSLSAAVVTAAQSAPGVDPFKASIPLLKEAAASDARVKRGDFASAPEALRLYREGVSLLMEASESPKYNEKVKAAMGKRLSLGQERLVQLAKICQEHPVALSADEPAPQASAAGGTVTMVAVAPREPPPPISPSAAPTVLHVPDTPEPALSLPLAPSLGLSSDMLRQAAEQAVASRNAVAEQAEARWAAAQEARKAMSESLAVARAEAAAQSAAAMAEATEAEARRQAEEVRKREAAAADRHAARAAAIAARQTELEARKVERLAAAQRHEEAAAARRQKREQAAASTAAATAAGQPDLSGDGAYIDWSGATASLTIEGLLEPLRTAMAAANVRRPLHPLSFIATQLQANAGSVVVGDSNGHEETNSQRAIEAFSYIESYESELTQAMMTCVVEDERNVGKEGGVLRSASQAAIRLAELLDQS